MPIITMLDNLRSSFVEGHSPSVSRANNTCPTISPAVRLRTSFCVPVWQNAQPMGQPTCDDTHNAPRSSSGMCTHSTSCPSSNFTSHLRVPSSESRRAETVGRPITKCSANFSLTGLARLLMAVKSVAPWQYIHDHTCLARKASSPSADSSAFSSSKLRPIRVLLDIVFTKGLYL